MQRGRRRYGDRRQPEPFRPPPERLPPERLPPERPRPARLLPAPLRLPAVALLACCVTVTVLLGITFAGQRHAGWLDTAVDTPVKSAFKRFPALLNVLADTGTLIPVTLMTLALVLACVATRRWTGAILAAVATPAASALTEFVLKPLVGRTIGGTLSLPSGHATSSFALAGTCAVLLLDPSGHRLSGSVRLVLASLALLVAKGAHYFTDVVAGTAVGIGMVLACALILDWLGPDRGALSWGAARRPARRSS
jgi:undecaprenyl-diphosphatase